MTGLFVWAPYASRVELELEGGSDSSGTPTSRPLERGVRGHFHLPDPSLAAGTRYRLRLDGSPGVPDPRSGYQPDGVHGPSLVVDQTAFAWTDAAFSPPPWSEGVVYEVHVGTFTLEGTFLALIGRLDYLVELGVTHLELMPVAAFPGQHGWGYDGVSLFAPHAAYGTPEDLKRLVDACHARGLAVILDVVYNHLGPDGNYLGRFGPYFTQTYATPWGAAVNLDQAGCDGVRRFFCDNALYWLECFHFDGLRLDAVHAFLDRGAHTFLEQLAEEVGALERRLARTKLLIAESDLNDPRLIREREAGGLGLHAQWSDDFHHSLHALLTGERNGYYADFGELEDLACALREGFVYAGRYSAHRGRSHGRPLGGLPLQRLLGYLQNHDQVGNRALGDRIGHSLSVERLELGAALVLTAPFVPMLFQGEEWNASTPFRYFTDHQNAELAEAVFEGRRKEFAAQGLAQEGIPDPRAPATFDASKLDWAEQTLPEHRRVLDWYRALLQLRRQEPALRSPEAPEVETAENAAGARWLCFRRGPLLVVANLSAVPLALPVAAGGALLLGSPGASAVAQLLRLPAWGVGILRTTARDRAHSSLRAS
jgi:maltooligosyltrehalose trehalohydrolase